MFGAYGISGVLGVMLGELLSHKDILSSRAVPLEFTAKNIFRRKT